MRRTAYVLVGLAVLGPVLAFAIGYLVFKVPTPDDAVNNQVATLTYADGSLLAKITPDRQGNRIKVGISAIPAPVQHAVLAAEDRSFYSNPGFDITGILRAAWDQMRGGTGGGSTITQQYVKLTLVGDEHSLWRKYKEVVIATKLSKRESKEQILDNYLNTVYFGRGAYGIEAGSQAYFGKDVGKLSPAEGALLASVIQAPSLWDPAINPIHARERWNYVMDGMVSQGWLPAADRAAATFPTTIPPRYTPRNGATDARGHIVQAVQDELARYGISEQEINQEGLHITTTINPQFQRQAVDAVHKQMAGQPANLRTALVAVDPRTGAIVAYYGGDDGMGFDYAQTEKQPGSSFKPFVLLAGLEHDPPFGLGSTFDGTSPQTIAGTKVANSDGESCGTSCDLKTAMTESVNTVYYNLGIAVGPQGVADAAHQAGVTAQLPDPTGGIAIGDKEVTPVDMASAYATFADNGTYFAPHLVSKVVTADGRVLYDAPNVGEQRIPANLARNVTESMVDVAGYSRIPLAGGRDVADKTGTVQSYVPGQNNDAWNVGYTPSLSAAVWVGTDDNSPIKDKDGRIIYGRMAPGSIWQSFMDSALKGTPEQSFGPFTPIGSPPPDTATAVPTSQPTTTAQPVPTSQPTTTAPTTDTFDMPFPSLTQPTPDPCSFLGNCSQPTPTRPHHGGGSGGGGPGGGGSGGGDTTPIGVPGPGGG